MILSTEVWAACATSSGLSPARIRAWMSRGRRALSIFISNRRDPSPRRAARRRWSMSTVCSVPSSSTRRRCFPSSLTATSVRCAIVGTAPVPTWGASPVPPSLRQPRRRRGQHARARTTPGQPLPTSLPRVSSPEPSTTLVVLDLAGIFVFAITGGLVAVRKGLDVFGVLVLAGTTGLGGGFLRDVLIDATPPAALQDWRYLVVPVAAGLLAFFYHPALGRVERSVNVLDAFGLGLFCVTGALAALDNGLGPAPAALMGMVTGIGGGMLRDLLAGRVPAVFRGELYATPALAGAVVVVAGTHLGLSVGVVAIAGGGLCTVWRVGAVWRDWQGPGATRPPAV